jgi:hypothetical protein
MLTSAQIENEIKQFVDSSELIINNGRKLLIKSLISEDISKVNQVYSYLSTLDSDANYSAFSFTEDIYLNIVFQNFEVILDRALNYSELFMKFRVEQDENLMRNASNLIEKNIEQIDAGIDKSSFSEEEKMLLKAIVLLFKVNYIDENYSLVVKQLKKDYPKSKYNPFINQYLPRQKIRGAIAFGMGVSYLVPTGNLAESFSGTPAFNMTYDINVGKTFISLYLQGGGFKLNTPFSAYNEVDTVTFNTGDSFNYIEGGILAGYFLMRSDRIQIAPFIGLSGASLESNIYSDPDDTDKEIPIINSFVLGLGVHTEFKFHSYEMINVYGYKQRGYFSLKLDAGYNIITKEESEIFSGNMAMIRAGIIWGLGEF